MLAIDTNFIKRAPVGLMLTLPLLVALLAR
jgi:hypothetical protein